MPPETDDLNTDPNIDPTDFDDDIEDSDESESASSTPAPKTVTVPSTTLGQVRLQERAALNKRLEREARSLGFASRADMVAMATEARKAQASKAPKPAPLARTEGGDDFDDEPVQPTRPAPTPVLTKRRALELQAENERLQADYANIRRMRAQAKAESRRLQSELSNARAESKLISQAIRAGVVDDSVDFAIDRLRKTLALKTPAEIASFDTQAFFQTDLRKRIPALYVVVEQPLETGTDESEEPTAPTTRTTQPTTRAAAPVTGRDARSLPRADVDARLRDLGIKS